MTWFKRHKQLTWLLPMLAAVMFVTAATPTYRIEIGTLYQWGQLVLVGDLSIPIAAGSTDAQINALIDAAPHQISAGANLSFDFADDVYVNIADTLLWDGFGGLGTLRIRGNTGESGLHTNQGVDLDCDSTNMHVLRFDNISCKLEISNIKVRVIDGYRGILIFDNDICDVDIRGCYVVGTGTALNGYGYFCGGSCKALVYNSYVSNIKYGIASLSGAILRQHTNASTGTDPTYGLNAAEGGILSKVGGTAPGGAESTATGGVIR